MPQMHVVKPQHKKISHWDVAHGVSMLWILMKIEEKNTHVVDAIFIVLRRNISKLSANKW